MKKSNSKQNGAVAIEFVMGFMLFWWLCMAWVELSYMSYISAVSDLAVSEASRVTKLDNTIDGSCEGCNQTYIQRFQQELSVSDSLWSQFIDPNKFRYSIQYLQTPEALEQLDENYCMVQENETMKACGLQENSAIAIYRINYSYRPMFNYFLNEEQLFMREVIVIQEYERDQFVY